VKLADTLDPEAEDPAAITAFLEQTVQRMIQKAYRQRAPERVPTLPLVRLRVTRCNSSSRPYPRHPFAHRCSENGET